MSDRNEFSVGLLAKFAGAVAEQSGTPDDLNRLAESPELIGKVIALVRGTISTVVVQILELVNGNISIPKLLETFIVRDKFVVDTSEKAKVKISYLENFFRNQFLNQEVAPRDGYAVSASKLIKKSADAPILEKLGEVYETDLGAMLHLMEQQPNGEEGVLLNNGYANIFYTRDRSGVLRAVCVLWAGGGWFVCAYPVEDPYDWSAGRRVFSRNS